MKKKEIPFTLMDLEFPFGPLGGKIVIERGQVFVHINAHGNNSYEKGLVFGLQYDRKIARLTVFGNINSEEPTHTIRLDGALESRRK